MPHTGKVSGFWILGGVTQCNNDIWDKLIRDDPGVPHFLSLSASSTNFHQPSSFIKNVSYCLCIYMFEYITYIYNLYTSPQRFGYFITLYLYVLHFWFLCQLPKAQGFFLFLPIFTKSRRKHSPPKPDKSVLGRASDNHLAMSIFCTTTK